MKEETNIFLWYFYLLCDYIASINGTIILNERGQTNVSL